MALLCEVFMCICLFVESLCEYPLVDTRLYSLYIYCLSVRNSQMIPLDLNKKIYIYIFEMQKKMWFFYPFLWQGPVSSLLPNLYYLEKLNLLSLVFPHNWSKSITNRQSIYTDQVTRSSSCSNVNRKLSFRFRCIWNFER